MAKACRLVAESVRAGYTKIHLDASMPLGGDPIPLPPELVARRAAELCATAEAAAGDAKPVYVIGTEVPTPGGAREALDHVEVTRVADLEATIDLHRSSFSARGLDAAWRRVIAVVVQPGVEFGHADVVHFVPAAAADLKAAIAAHGGLAFEAHSTDYQRPEGLRALVDSHFAVLKVGPWLTFALREAIFALDAIERELLPDGRRAGARRALESAMLADPTHWRAYYLGSEREQAIDRAFSLSDRSRYYWALPEVGGAVERLMANLAAAPIPLPLLSQYLPAQHAGVHEGRLPNEPRALIKDKVRAVARIYAGACGTSAAP
jgi:D-tagatose-1,6-bisphosphate aldolase subunit GatZ/KbaZ